MRMNKIMFMNEMMKELMTCLNGTYVVSVVEEKRVNTMCTGISIYIPDMCMSSSFYIDDLYHRYEQGESFSSILNEVYDHITKIGLLSTSLQKSIFENYTRFENAAGHIKPQLVHAERNKEFLQDKPHRIICDLALCYAIHVKDETKNGAWVMDITDSLMKQWNIKEEDLFQEAKRNLTCGYLQICNALMSGEKNVLCWDPSAVQDPPRIDGWSMYILTNQSTFRGAPVIINKEFMNWVTNGKNVLLLPSSIHEWIMISGDGIEVAYFKEMVEEVNRTQVAEPDILSDSVYTWRNGELVQLT